MEMGKEGGHYVDALAHSHMIEGQQVPEKENLTYHAWGDESGKTQRMMDILAQRYQLLVKKKKNGRPFSLFLLR